MNSNNLLLINSSGRIEGSITRNVSSIIAKQLQLSHELNIIDRDLIQGLPFIDESWIGATFTPIDQRTTEQHEALSFSDALVKELEEADTIVIASPIYNFGIPAALKAWVDLTARAQLTFRYTENGPEGLLKNKRAYIVIASGGVPIGSAKDFASPYLKQALSFIGITDVTIIDASKINHARDESKSSPESQLAPLLNE